MLSISKIGAGQEAYYLDAVAQGVEDYYLGHGEAPGSWAGSATELLGLAGQVHADDLRAVLEGRDPRDRVRLIQARKDRVPGFDLTFSAPKSVSVLYGLGDPDTVRAVRVAHDRAVDAALDWLEREASWSRRGPDGIETIGTDGFVAAAFVHRSSRAGDPQLHTHVLVANLTRCDDGMWRALHGLPLFWQARTAGYLYKAQLRHELTASLGLDWGPVHKGAAEIAGIPAELCALFSTRRHEIEDELEARNAHTPQAARIAALETRQAKNYGVDVGALRDQWRARAREAGHDPTVVDQALHRVTPSPLDNTEIEARIDHLLGPTGLTEQRTAFDRRVVLRAWCEQLPRGAAIATIERLARGTLADPRVVPLVARDPYPLHSTTELLGLERRLIELAASTQDGGVGVAGESSLRAALDARPELSPEQVAAVATITTSGNGVDVVVAAAGTGKTFCLDAARDAWHRAGYRVIGATLAATAARHLQAHTAIPSDTIALRTIQLAEGGLELDAQTVVVIDEAVMASTRGLAPILEAAHRARSKVALVGDPHQLDAIEAGGVVYGLAHRLRPVTLRENRRQREAWERDALAQLRAGKVVTALAAYEAHHRVVMADTAIDVRNLMVADWHAAAIAGHSAVMVAERRADVDDLNRRARRALIHAKAIRGPRLDVDSNAFQAGDRVLCLRNNRRLGVQNGTVATVTDVDTDGRAIDIRTDDGMSVRLPSAYLDAGHLSYAYARTIHKTQGLTVERCLILASDTLDHQAGYTALSRGRADNRIYLVSQPEPDPERHHPVRHATDVRRELAHALGTDRRQQLALDQPVDTGELRRQVARLYSRWQELAPVRDAMPDDRRADIAALEHECATERRALHDAQAHLGGVRAEHLRLRGRREHAARVLTAERAYEQASSALDRVEAALLRARSGQAEWASYVSAHADPLQRLQTLELHIDQRLDQLIDAVADTRPGYLRALGSQPGDGWQREAWRRAVSDVEAYRAQHGVSDRDLPLGEAPRDPVDHTAWRRATSMLDLAAKALDVADRAIRHTQESDHGLEVEL
jgi:conjugative relaxase-like TrwC/TraI family protein